MKATTELTATEITKQALEKLRELGYTVWRQQNSTYGNRKNIATKGVPDIIGYSDTGLFVGCEVKKIGDTFKQDQLNFLRALKKGGGIALYAIQVGSEVKILKFETTIKEAVKRYKDIRQTESKFFRG